MVASLIKLNNHLVWKRPDGEDPTSLFFFFFFFFVAYPPGKLVQLSSSICTKINSKPRWENWVAFLVWCHISQNRLSETNMQWIYLTIWRK
jgi:hypothetical protein